MNPNNTKAPKANGTIILRYLKRSKQLMGQAYYDVLSPKLPGYIYSEDSGFPTFSLETLKAKGLLDGRL